MIRRLTHDTFRRSVTRKFPPGHESKSISGNMQANNDDRSKEKPPKSKRKFHPKKKPRNVSSKTSELADDVGCLNKKICKGKHTKFEPNETFTKNAAELFKDQQIRIVTTLEQCRVVISEMRRHLDEYNALGFDCEWLSQYRRYPVALLQLCTHRGLCALFRLCIMKTIPEELKQLLEDESVVKVGIQPYVDARYLIQDYKIDSVASTLDLRKLAMECGSQSRSGLGHLAEEHLGVQLNKNRCICASNWEAETLHDIQIDYAAKDAQVSIELFKVFEKKLNPQTGDCNQKDHVQRFIEEKCAKYLNLKGMGDPDAKPKETINYFENQEIRYVDTVDRCLESIKLLTSHCEEYNVLGFKLIKTNDGSSPAHLLQLASHRRLSVIVNLKMVNPIPETLQEILNDKRIIKVGIRPECNILEKYNVTGTLDLSHLLNKHKKKQMALPLHALSKWFLKVKLNKNPSKKLENVKKNLDKNEAHISIELFKEFVKKFAAKSGDNDDNHEIDLKQFIETHCLEYLDKKFEKLSVVNNEMEKPSDS